MTGPLLAPTFSTNIISSYGQSISLLSETDVLAEPEIPILLDSEPFHAVSSGGASTTTVGMQNIIGNARFFLGYAFDNTSESEAGRLEAQLRYSSALGTLYGRGAYDSPGLEGTDTLTLESAFETPSRVFGFHLWSAFNGLNSDNSEETSDSLRLAPIFKTPGFDLAGLRGVRLGFSPQMRFNTSTGYQDIVLRSKLEWSYPTDRWSGSSVEVYVSANDGDVNPLGVYVWSGGYVPNIVGEGNMLIEGGAWLGAAAFQGSEPFGQALLAGLMLRVTFSGSSSGFEPGRYSGM